MCDVIAIFPVDQSLGWCLHHPWFLIKPPMSGLHGLPSCWHLPAYHAILLLAPNTDFLAAQPAPFMLVPEATTKHQLRQCTFIFSNFVSWKSGIKVLADLDCS